ncbi:MAG: BPSS1780 family membrane protein [Betaproteobacteria bacterium]
MQVNRVTAGQGLRWLIEGFGLLRRQPLGLSAMVVIYLMMLLVPALIPLVGIVFAGVLSPFATVGLMHCMRDAAAGRAPVPAAFALPFRDETARTHLFRLGLVNAALVSIVAVLALLLVPESPSSGPPRTLDELPLDGLLLQMVLYLPVLALMWFSPLLAGWHRVSPAKAMFGSVIACLRNLGAMLVYAFSTALALVSISVVIISLLTVFISSRELLSFFVAPVALALMTVVQASFYPMYRDLFADSAASTAAASLAR